ncbi:MAG: hypothetical protein A2750_02990 [Candidatus Yanofskybacteria bacterium RIFCSPHIGHO2_01_FULL_45_42]|uniref:Uncharacterized protein n=1 Tax=Candidatus Yanofskybacteria bacterium RIFCSPHIGHO2_01_FULL_45_42 TaxID=1802671 RepID=A0A1F8F174_9BACT|nr:MAG: hypothetical protein A2750_02990 [Candidatus Yanofskybacteria bacterium RIFCSPHIGHO2_01_FULL_45_42]
MNLKLCHGWQSEWNANNLQRRETMNSVRVFRLQVPVNYDLEWAEAIRRGAPNTSESSLIWTVSDQFPTDKKGTVTESVFVTQLGPSFRHQAALNYAVAEKKPHAHPRVIWAIGECHPKLAREQGKNWMFLNSGLTCAVDGYVFVPFLVVLEDGLRGADVYVVQCVFRELSSCVFGE